VEKVPSGDIFYCSGSRQLNHSSYYYYYLAPPQGQGTVITPGDASMFVPWLRSF